MAAKRGAGISFGNQAALVEAVGGSALGVKFARSSEELPGALVGAFSYDRTVLIERYVKGRDLAVSMVDGDAPSETSARGALAEVVGDAAEIVDPDDPQNIANAIERVLTDTGLREDLIAHGLERDLGGNFRPAQRLQEAPRPPDGAVLGQRPPRLAHEPHGRALDRLAPGGAHEKRLHRRLG